MPTVAYQKYLPSVDSLTKGGNVATDTWKVALSNTFTNTDSAFVAGTTDLATGNGYTAGGNAAALTSATTAAGTMTLTLGNPTAWTASGAVGPFRYAIVYNATTGVPFGAYDYGSSVSLASGDTFTFTFPGSTFTVA